jgi:outer membrane immunogenic protein
MRILCGASIVALIAVAAPAFAADLPAKTPAAAPFSWTGCYMGAHIGGVMSQDTRTSVFGQSSDFGSSGFVGGGQIGCDYQFESGWVVGGEGRVAGTTLKYRHAANVTFPDIGTTVPSQFFLGNDVLASVTARLGYRFADRWLGYVRGGGAITHENVDDAFTNAGGLAVDPTGSLTRTGWTVGAGVDWAFAPNWSANIEYNYYDFGSTGMTVHSVTDTVNEGNIKDTIHAVTTGVNYHF